MEQNQMQQIVNRFLSDLGNERHNVMVEVQEETPALAHAIGAKIVDKPVGKVVLSEGLSNLLTVQETRFVLGHEAVHIDQNHIATKALFRVPKVILKGLENQNENAKSLRVLWDLARAAQTLGGGEPLEAEVTRENEYQADLWSIWLNQDARSAFSCLQKLVGGDLDELSHTWEAFDYNFPAMTMGDRLEDLHQALTHNPELPDPPEAPF